MSIGTPDWVGTPSVDRLTQVYEDTAIALASGAAAAIPVQNVSQFQSLQVFSQESPGIYVGTLPRLHSIAFYADAAGTKPLGTYAFRVPVQGGILNGQIPVLGPYMIYSLAAVATGNATSVNMRIFGSYRPLTRPRVRMECSIAETMTIRVAFGTGTTVYTGTVLAGNTLSAFPSHWVGPATVMIRSGPIAANPAELAILDLTTAQRLDSIYVPVSAIGQAQRFSTYLLGEFPEFRYINPTANPVVISLAIIQEGYLP